MAILEDSNQYLYTGRGPYDAKSLVKTYDQLLLEDTWISSAGKIIAYNGMIVAVWLNQDDASKNGIYYLFDDEVTSTFKAPNVTDPAHWHKISDKVDLSSIEDRLDALEAKESILTYGYRSAFPSIGMPNVLYIASDEGASYVWVNNDYYQIGASEPDIIDGGAATNI